MRSRHSHIAARLPAPPWRPWLLAAVLAGGAAAVEARVNWGFNIDLGWPYGGTHAPLYGPSYGPIHGDPYGAAYGGMAPVLPSASVGVQIGGHHRGHHGGHHGGGPYRSWGPSGWLVVPSILFALPFARSQPALAPTWTAVPMPPSRPDPLIDPRHGQGAQQTEFDRQACNRQAATQQAALADSAVFMRTVDGCMDERGYSIR